MKQITNFFKKLQLGKLLTVFLAGVVLLVTTACNNGNLQGARPNNSPVQMGGQNNPHKMGGDGMTEYKMSTDPAVKNRSTDTIRNQRDRADLQLVYPQLIADANIKSNASDILYPGSDATSNRNPDIGPSRDKSLQEIRIPSERQPVLDRSDPDANILERIGEQFEDATSFLKDTAESATERPEMQRNPALGK